MIDCYTAGQRLESQRRQRLAVADRFVTTYPGPMYRLLFALPTLQSLGLLLVSLIACYWNSKRIYRAAIERPRPSTCTACMVRLDAIATLRPGSYVPGSSNGLRIFLY